MAAIAFYPHPLSSFNKHLKLGKSIISPGEIADWPLLFATQKNPHKITVLSISSDGNRRSQQPQKGFAAGRMEKGDGNELPQSSDSKVSSSSDKEEIIALFERIKSSISKAKTLRTKKRNPRTSENKVTFGSIVDVLHQPEKEEKGRSSNQDWGIKKWRRQVPKKERKKRRDKPVTDFKLTRLPSSFVKRSPIPSLSAPRGNILEPNREPSSFVKRSPIPSPSAPRGNIVEPNRKQSSFVKRSPIPSSSAPRGNIVEPNSEPSANTERSNQLKLPRVEELKLPQLKELAKARGIKGYSRMKKSELVTLLRS